MAEAPGADNRENVFQIVQELNRNSYVTLEIRSQVADILDQSISEIEHFRSHLLTAHKTSAIQEENQSNDLIYAAVKGQCTDSTEDEDCVGKHNLLHQAVEFPLIVTSEQLSTLDSIGPSSDSDQNSPINVDTQQNYNLQNTNTDYCKPADSNASFESEEVDCWRQYLYSSLKKGTEEVDFESLSISDSTFNVNEGGLLSSTMKNSEFEDIVQDATLQCSTDLIQPCDLNYFSPEYKENESTLEKTEDNKNTSDKENLDKLCKSMHEGTTGLKTLIADEVKIPNHLESKAFQKILRELHTDSEFLSSENLQCREQINTLRTEKSSLHVQLSIAEQKAEVYHQQVKALTDKCEELFKQKKQIQDESNHLMFEKQLLAKEIELLKEEKKNFLKDLAAANTEKEELIKKLESSQKTALSYAREKEDLHHLWNETLMENYNLRRETDESRAQNLENGTFKWTIEAFYI
ncbi:coiled-coil domain-containing protein 110 [Aquarana catesbeiana]|uniref:coiled-coil domain-containing protein 110 n=1 Tax=Aquarana catesbeiana TaxID=8400 RepID=UPI003CCA2709